MKELFYMWAIFALLFELSLMRNPSRWIKFKKTFKGVKYENMTSNQKSYGVMAMLYIAWAMVGLFSAQWILFIVMLFIGLPLSVFKESKIAKSIDGFLSACLILFILVNAFHLHIDMLEYIKTLF